MSTKLTLASINEALAEHGIDAKLTKVGQIFAFTGPAVEGATRTRVCVSSLDSMTIVDWLTACREIMEEAKW